ncbi:MAG: flagellar biosynthetic protein FliO [Rhodothermales bacterium]
MSKFFPFLPGPPATGQPPLNRSLLKRILFFATALMLLWVALQLKPSSPTFRDSSRLFTDNGGSVAARPDEADAAKPFAYGPWLAGLVLAGLLGFAAFRYRQMGMTPPAPQPIETLARHTLGPGQELHIVRCAGQTLLLGVTANQIALIDRLPDVPDAPEEAPAPADKPDFTTFLYRAIRTSNGN